MSCGGETLVKRIQQLIKHDPDNGKWGDCYRTCIAMIMSLDPATVPHFYDLNEGLIDAREWLAGWGYGLAQFNYPPDVDISQLLKHSGQVSPSCPFIFTGMGPRGNNHCVVAIDGKVFCDPFSGEADQEPFTGPATHNRESFWWLETIVVLPNRFALSAI
jgi:hypothetical protein